jgi:hypothetical protein
MYRQECKSKCHLWTWTACIFALLLLFNANTGMCIDTQLLENSKVEFNGKPYEIKHPDIRDGKIVFYTNLYSDTPVSYFKAGDGSKIPLNFKVFVADITDETISNIKRLTSNEGSHEINPFWTADGNIVYTETSGASDSKPVYRVTDKFGKALKNISEKEYVSLKKESAVESVPSLSAKSTHKIRETKYKDSGVYIYLDSEPHGADIYCSYNGVNWHRLLRKDMVDKTMLTSDVTPTEYLIAQELAPAARAWFFQARKKGYYKSASVTWGEVRQKGEHTFILNKKKH